MPFPVLPCGFGGSPTTCDLACHTQTTRCCRIVSNTSLRLGPRNSRRPTRFAALPFAGVHRRWPQLRLGLATARQWR